MTRPGRRVGSVPTRGALRDAEIKPEEAAMPETTNQTTKDRRPVYGPPEPSWRVLCDFVLYGDWCGHCGQGRRRDDDWDD